MRIPRSVKVGQFIRDTLYFEAGSVVAVVVLVALFGFPLWLVLTAVALALIATQRGFVFLHSRGRQQWERHHDAGGSSSCV